MRGAAPAALLAAALVAAPLAGLVLARPVLAADQAVEQKAQVCLACHGPASIAANPVVPSIAGQPRQFIATELYQFREGRRKSPEMSPIAAGLSNADMNALAVWFAAQPAPVPSRRSDPASAATAQRLVSQLNCVSCHGPSLTGQQHIPRLAGQQVEYLRAQLRGFKASTRADIDGLMTSAAQPLSEGDIDLLAEYLADLGG